MTTKAVPSDTAGKLTADSQKRDKLCRCKNKPMPHTIWSLINVT